ncbi:MAG: hypothetical protein JO297_00820 [Nitrososphaeraceae archaeon]|nr:hypothetical protein [Nitrososphaeraceae archaeon]
MTNWPLFKQNKKLREELDKVRKERDYYERQLESERAKDLADDYNKDWVPDNR